MIDLTGLFPVLQDHILQLMSQKINRIKSIRPNSQAKERLASFLVNYLRRIQSVQQDAMNYVLQMSRFEIGNYIGLSAETVTRTFNHFKKENILDCSGKLIVIYDYQALNRLSCPFASSS